MRNIIEIFVEYKKQISIIIIILVIIIIVGALLDNDGVVAIYIQDCIRQYFENLISKGPV